jgi:hypothetical protein
MKKILSITFGSEAGTSTAPKTANITVANSYSSIGAAQVTANSTGTTKTVYTDAAFTNAGSVNLTAGVPTHVYIKVVAEDGVTTMYYDVTVTRSS